MMRVQSQEKNSLYIYIDTGQKIYRHSVLIFSATTTFTLHSKFHVSFCFKLTRHNHRSVCSLIIVKMAHPQHVSLLPRLSEENFVENPEFEYGSGSGSGLGIPGFFNGKSVFITGATGYLGSALIEKILRSCPGVKQIFILIRPKRGCEAQNRLDNLLNSPLFDGLLKAEGGEKHREKLVPIPGDLSLPNLGISEENISVLCSQVSIVVHSAAMVKFEEPLQFSMTQNVQGTRSVLNLAVKMPNLQSLVYVSTAFSNCERRVIEEIVYPTSIKPEDAIKLVCETPEDLMDYVMEQKILGNKPNTYTFTKHLAEKLVEEFRMRHKIPACIVRPSIVAPTHKSPFPGWVDNYQGTSGVFIAMGLGYLRTMKASGNCRADFIPLDHIVNLIISAAWATATGIQIQIQEQDGSSGTAQESTTLTIPVYNSTSGADNPVTWNQVGKFLNRAVWKFPFQDMIWYPDFSNFYQSQLVNLIYENLFHHIPATVGDSIATLSSWPIFKLQFQSKLTSTQMSESKSNSKSKSKPTLKVVYSKLHAATHAVEVFVNQDWDFSTKNTRQLLFQLSPIDRQTFDFDICAVNWEEFMLNYVVGLQKYTLKQNVDLDQENYVRVVNQNRKKLQRFYLLHRGLQFAGFLALLLLFTTLINNVS